MPEWKKGLDAEPEESISRVCVGVCLIRLASLSWKPTMRMVWLRAEVRWAPLP